MSDDIEAANERQNQFLKRYDEVRNKRLCPKCGGNGWMIITRVGTHQTYCDEIACTLCNTEGWVTRSVLADYLSVDNWEPPEQED